MAEIRRVDPEAMTEYANKLDNQIGQWADSIREITQLKQEIDEMWDGLSNDEFNARWENDLNRYNNLQVLLDNYRRAALNAAARYEEKENEIAGIVRHK